MGGVCLPHVIRVAAVDGGRREGGAQRQAYACVSLLCSCSAMSDSFVTPWTAARQAPLSILQARVLEGVAIPFSRGSSQPRDRTCVAGRFLITDLPGKFFLISGQFQTQMQNGTSIKRLRVLLSVSLIPGKGEEGVRILPFCLSPSLTAHSAGGHGSQSPVQSFTWLDGKVLTSATCNSRPSSWLGIGQPLAPFSPLPGCLGWLVKVWWGHAT